MPVSRGIRCRRPLVGEQLFGCPDPVQNWTCYRALPVLWLTCAHIFHLQQGCNDLSAAFRLFVLWGKIMLWECHFLLFFCLGLFFCRIPSETRHQHVLGILRQRKQHGRVQRRCRRPQQRLLPGRPNIGAARLPALHHLSHTLHRWVSKTGERFNMCLMK